MAALFGIEMAPPPVASAPPTKNARKRGKEKTPAASLESSEGNAENALGAVKKSMKAPGARKVAAKAGTRSKASEPRGFAPADVAKGETAAPTKSAAKSSKTETQQRTGLKAVASAPGGRSGKIKQASGRTRAAKWIGAKARKSRG